eukprot:9671424-Ditylum_brightwellii.AAC.1
MFSNPIEISQFVNSHHTQYLDQWIRIWQSYFRRGVITATRRAIENTSLITSYFYYKTSTARAFLPHGFQAIHNGLDNDCPVGIILTNLAAWITSDKLTSNL